MDGGVIVNERFSKPGQERTSKSAWSPRTTSDTSQPDAMDARDQENLPGQSGANRLRDGCARISQQVSDGAQSLCPIPAAKRARVTHRGILPSEYAHMPRTMTRGQPPALLEKCDHYQDKSRQPRRRPLESIEKGAPYTGGELPCSEQEEPKRPGMRPRVKQRLSASAMAGNAFCTIAMIVLTVSACAANPDIAIHPTAIQLDPVTRAQMLLSSDMREWKDAEEKELASMKSNNVFTECNLPAV